MGIYLYIATAIGLVILAPLKQAKWQRVLPEIAGVKAMAAGS